MGEAFETATRRGSFEVENPRAAKRRVSGLESN